MSDDFNDRAARLEEHLELPTADEWLDRAEEAHAAGDESKARHCLTMGKIARNFRTRAVIEELEGTKDDAAA